MHSDKRPDGGPGGGPQQARPFCLGEDGGGPGQDRVDAEDPRGGSAEDGGGPGQGRVDAEDPRGGSAEDGGGRLWNADTSACVDHGHARPPPCRSARAGARAFVDLPGDEKDAGRALETFVKSAEAAVGELESLSFVASAALRARVVLANSAARRVAGLTDGTYNSPPPVATPSSSLAPLSSRKRPSADIAGPVGPKKKFKTSPTKKSSPVSLSSSGSSSSSSSSSPSSEDEKKKKRKRKEKKL